jgi:epoxyqueuosine reductase QueG
MTKDEIPTYIESTIRDMVGNTTTVTKYRQPLIAYVSAEDSNFANLKKTVHPTHRVPQDLLPGARTVLSYFLPFEEKVVEANSIERERVAIEWVRAYIETNQLIEGINKQLIVGLEAHGVKAAAEVPTGNFDDETLTSPWSHKSIAVIAGIGSFGLHQLVITDLGCAGRFGSLVMDADITIQENVPKERCLYFIDGSCLECVLYCPSSAIDEQDGLNKRLCSDRCKSNAYVIDQLGRAEVCGKCSIGVCAFEDPSRQ